MGMRVILGILISNLAAQFRNGLPKTISGKIQRNKL